MGTGERCGGCGYAARDVGWPGYACPRCGRLNARLYRAEHADPGKAARLTLAAIAAEYAAAGDEAAAARVRAQERTEREASGSDAEDE